MWQARPRTGALVFTAGTGVIPLKEPELPPGDRCSALQGTEKNRGHIDFFILSFNFYFYKFHNVCDRQNKAVRGKLCVCVCVCVWCVYLEVTCVYTCQVVICLRAYVLAGKKKRQRQ